MHTLEWFYSTMAPEMHVQVSPLKKFFFAAIEVALVRGNFSMEQLDMKVQFLSCFKFLIAL
jgi:hypothetical protein